MEKILFKKLDKSKITSLLKTIKKIRIETKNHDSNIDKINFWKWQYRQLPSRKSLVYVALIKKKIIGYYHIPVYNFYIKKKLYKIGSIQSVAILKKYRKKNVFRKLSNFANHDANKYLDLIYTFPNQKSIGTFLKYDKFNYISTLPFYIYPIKSSNLLNSQINFFGFNLTGNLIDFSIRLFSKKLDKEEKIIFFDKFNKKILDLFHKFNSKHSFYLKRDYSYLNWKYKKSPKSNYLIFGLKKNKELKAVTVVKVEKIFKCHGIIIMDFAYSELCYMKKLLLNLNNSKNFKAKKNISFILLTGITTDIEKFRSCGFLKVPKNLVPRNLNLLAKSKFKSINNSIKDKSSWLITLSDWDVF